MGVGTDENTWWNDVLENGPASRFSEYFDIAWRASGRPALHDKVLLPVLAEPYGDILEAGGLRLVFDQGALSIHYENRRFPVAPASYAEVLGHALPDARQEAGSDIPAHDEIRRIVTAIRNLPDRTGNSPAVLLEFEHEKKGMQCRLAELCAGSPAAARLVEQTLARFNGEPGDPRSFDLLDHLLDQQCYRLAYWRVAPDEINYRRFFDVNDLAGLSMERPEVFEAAHALILPWLAQGKVDGLRIDHPDGLYDPAQYFRRLQRRFRLACVRQVFEEAPASGSLNWSDVEESLRERLDDGEHGAWESAGGPPLYVLAEKILGVRESLVETWPVAGTTGYDFLNQIGGLFVDDAGAAPISRLYQSTIDDDTRFPELAYRKKLLILRVSLASELHMLTTQLDRLAQQSRRSRDFTFNTLGQVLGEVIACFPVYRSYIDDAGASDSDRRYVEAAVRRARLRNPLLSRRVFRFIRDLLLGDASESFGAIDRSEQRRFAGKFQQVTSPVTAKAVEDTAFYVYNRLVSLNEVGGDPSGFGKKADELHLFNQDRQARWPFALSPLSTHDTKRSEDVRARINVLSQLPREWADCVERWRRWNEPHRKAVDDVAVPDANEEYLLYQTLIGAWPLGLSRSAVPGPFVKRIQDYMLKAGHEAKVHSSWLNPNADYDAAVQDFVGLILDDRSSGAFLDDFRSFQATISHYGLLDSLSQTLLKLVSPGVPDTYQGTELWDFSLVDPDNRRPVDYGLRRQTLSDLQAAVEATAGDRRELCRTLIANKEDGRVKLYLHWCVLHARREHPGLFTTGDYRPLEIEGTNSALVFAFARENGPTRAVIAVPRLWTRLVPVSSQQWLYGASTAPAASASDSPESRKDVWQDARLMLNCPEQPTRWHNLFTGESLIAADRNGGLSIDCSDLFAHFPIALLMTAL